MPPVAAARPDHLELPPGNEEVRRRLVALARAGRLHHCLIFEGPQGVGKADSARWLAMLVNCQGPAELLGPRTAPCGSCWSCKNIARGQHPDVIELGLDPEKVTPIISVEQARALLGKLTLHPFNAQQRFVVVDPADALTVEAANALLKTLEEPPPGTGFLLVTARSSGLLATVRSRSQRVRFNAVPEAALVPWLEARGISQATRVARLAMGCPGRALALADGGIRRVDEIRDQLLDALAGGSPRVFEYAEALTRKGDSREAVDQSLDALEVLLRDAAVVAAGRPEATLNTDLGPLLQAWAQALWPTGLERLQRRVDEARVRVTLNVNGRLLLEALLSQVVLELGAAARRPR